MSKTTMDPTRRRLVVGLGNPGRRYRGTRHNVGFDVVELLADRWQASSSGQRFDALLADAAPSRGGRMAKVTLVEPQTFMNRSGRAVRQAMDFYSLEARNVLVVLDDMNLPVGKLRARPEGSAGGQKGMDDILKQLGTKQVPRLRIGIGAPPPRWDPADYVLGKFDDKELEEMKVARQEAADAVEDWIFEGMTRVMERYNRRAAD
jgi:peptidyl-tRNA hydrolase, PTH1 family